MTDAAGFTDEVEIEVNGELAAVSTASGLMVVEVPDPNDPATYTDDGELTSAGGVIFVAAPVGSTVEDAMALLGEPGEVKGPSPAVWGDASADAFAFRAEHPDGPEPLPEGVKGPAEDRMADEVLDPEE